MRRRCPAGAFRSWHRGKNEETRSLDAGLHADVAPVRRKPAATAPIAHELPAAAVNGEQLLCLRACQCSTGAERPPFSPIFEAAATRARAWDRRVKWADSFNGDVTGCIAKGDEEVIRIASRVGVRQLNALRSAQRPLPGSSVSPIHPKEVRSPPAHVDRQAELVLLQGDRPSSDRLRPEEVDRAVASWIPGGGQPTFVPG